MKAYLLLAGLIAAAVLVNMPLGFLREKYEKFTLEWWFYVHISIPLIIYLRVKAGVSWKFIPLTIGAAILGQYAGGRYRRRRRGNGA